MTMALSFFTADGYKLPDELEEQIEQLIDSYGDQLPFATDDKLGRISSYQNAAGEYAAVATRGAGAQFVGTENSC